MNYKKILENKPLIFIDRFLRRLGFYIELEVDNETKKILSVKLRKKYL
jgi:hypothetical protein